MNKIIIIHGLIIFLGVFISDPFCQVCLDKEKSKSSFCKTSLKRVDKLKVCSENWMITNWEAEKSPVVFSLSSSICSDLKHLISSYQLSFKSIRAPPLV